MNLTAGTRLGPYEIVAPIGAGGMGEVYRGRDTRLDRSVAIKVLSAQLTARLPIRERFEREARAISRLSHPHICTLFDVGAENGTDYLVMEYLEGETLADRITRGPLSVDQVLRFGREIADALAAAHRMSVVHRDLKPGNIVLTRSGVKLLDFGLAKLLTSESTAVASDSSLTQHRPLTEEGTILGTFQYMAPEQLEGIEADARTDIFALGAVLYEMITGRRAFEGKSRTSLIAAIVDRDPPPISSLQPLTPPALERVIRTCLAKDPDERWQSAHDVAAELRWISEAGSIAGIAAPAVEKRRRRLTLASIVAVLMTLTAIALGVLLYRSETKSIEPLQASVLAPPGVRINILNGPVALSPDGSKIAFPAQEPNGRTTLWIRTLATRNAVSLPGTEDGSYPFWSPDGRSIGFFASGKLRRVDSGGGPPQTLCEALIGRGGSWSRNNVILFSVARDAIYEIPAAGGAPKKVVSTDPSKGEADVRYPWFLPDGKHFLYLARAEDPEESSVWVAELGSTERKRLLQASSHPIYANGYLVFPRERVLLAQRFDARSLTLEGDPTPLAEGITYLVATAHAIYSAAGSTLVYAQGSPQAQLVVLDRDGRETAKLGSAGDHNRLALSPDGTRLAVDSNDEGAGRLDIWIHDLTRSTATRFTFHPTVELGPVWSPDGTKIVFTTGPKRPAFDLAMKSSSAAGGETMLWQEPGSQRMATSWSRDGRFLLVDYHQPQNKIVNDIWLYSIEERKATPLVQSAFSEFSGSFSPDGKWFAYSSNESGKQEVYAQAVRGSGKWQISSNGGLFPRWSPKGDEIFYLNTQDSKLMSVPVRTGATLEQGDPRELFRVRFRMVPGQAYDVFPDGKRFAAAISTADSDSPPLSLITNWPALVESR